MAADGRPLKVLFVGINYAPEPTGIAPYTAGMASGLRGLGHDVRVVTGFPHYPQWKVSEGYTGASRREELDDVDVHRVRHYVPRDPSTVRRSLMEVTFGMRAIARRWGKPDVVVLVSPALLASRLVMARARARGVPVVTWMQDIYTLGLVQTGGDARQERLIRTVETSLLDGSRRVVVIHDRFKSWIEANLATRTPVSVVRNWSHVEAPAVPDREAVRRRLGWAPEDVVVLHAGNMGAKQGLESVVRAARTAADSGSRVRFALLGDGNRRRQLEAMDPHDRLQFIDPLPDGEFEAALASADLLLVNELPGLTEMSVPSKLTTYYATGLPVLAAVSESSTSADEVRLAGAGVVVPAGDPEALVREAERLADDPALAASLGESGRRFRSERLTATAAVRAFEEVLQSVRR